ncbi:bis(5'-nucleosyl)-tetraphosphatase (symmetrical) YqeK [Enterococcus sp. LJL98]
MIDWTNDTKETRIQLMQKVQMQMSEVRFKHVLGVEQTAVALAEKYGCSVKKASIAALVHDYAKERSDDEFRSLIEEKNFDPALLQWGNAIWHGIIGAYLVEHELGIQDEEILQAVRVHTTGAKEMSVLDKILYVADYIEPGRTFPGVAKARTLAEVDLDQAVAYETQQTLLYLIERKYPIYPKTIETYNRWVTKQI